MAEVRVVNFAEYDVMVPGIVGVCCWSRTGVPVNHVKAMGKLELLDDIASSSSIL